MQEIDRSKAFMSATCFPAHMKKKERRKLELKAGFVPSPSPNTLAKRSENCPGPVATQQDGEHVTC